MIEEINVLREEDIKKRLFDNQRLLTIPQLSVWLQVPQKTIRDWVYRRRIPFRKVGNLIRFKRSEIQRWIR